MDYRDAGVDIQKGNRIVDWLKSKQAHHHKDRILSGIGGFSSLFKADFPEMEQPCLAGAVDGVGTKVKLASRFSSFKGIGQDLVAMCVNDLICAGAHPLFFLDYYASGRIHEPQIKEFLNGLHGACDQAFCSLIGGETAEMPDCYKENDFDCAGFALGIVDYQGRLGAHKVKKGDQLVALPSSGFHSNGYSLLRKVFAKDLDQWAEELLKPTTIYVDVFKKILKNKVHALAHITGGGLDNILRVSPKGSRIQLKPWPIPSPFMEVQKRVNLDWKKLLTALNCGLGMVAFVDPDLFDEVMGDLKNFGMEGLDVGVLEDIDPRRESSWNVDDRQWKTL